jgi:hypothetical protein
MRATQREGAIRHRISDILWQRIKGRHVRLATNIKDTETSNAARVAHAWLPLDCSKDDLSRERDGAFFVEASSELVMDSAIYGRASNTKSRADSCSRRLAARDSPAE